jgi:CRISPR-associated protein Csc2
MNLPDILSKGEDYIYEEVPKTTTGRMAHIAVMRKTDSYNIFTTEGSELNMAETEKTTENSEKVQRVVMFKRKQVASERRTGKAELRGLYENHEDEIDRSEAFGDFGGDELCRLHDNLGGECIDCKLYGFANAQGDGNDGVSRSSRVLTDSAFSIRDIERREDITFNAQSEEAEADSSTALNSRAHTKPETYFPSIITLKDFTYRELYWLVYMIENTTRYGAETSRTGYVDNKVVSVWFDTSETMSNLELTQRVTAELEDEEDPNSGDVEEAVEGSVPEPEVDVNALRDTVEEVTGSDKDKIEFLENLHRSQAGDLSE